MVQLRKNDIFFEITLRGYHIKPGRLALSMAGLESQGELL